MLSVLREDLLPVGQLETLLVEKIAVSVWRLRRLQRYETGAFEHRLEWVLSDLVQEYWHRIDRMYLHAPEAATDLERLGTNVTDDAIAQQAARVKQVSDPAWLPEDSADEGSDPDGNGPTAGTGPDHEGSPDPLVGARSQQPKTAQETAEDAHERLQQRKRQIIERERRLLKAMQVIREREARLAQLVRTGVLPTPEDLDKILKYEASLGRAWLRDLDVLLKLQRQRPERATSDGPEEIVTERDTGEEQASVPES
jgi:hypothetical protein